MLFDLASDQELRRSFKMLISPHLFCWSRSLSEGPRLHRGAWKDPGCWLRSSKAKTVQRAASTGVWSEASVNWSRYFALWEIKAGQKEGEKYAQSHTAREQLLKKVVGGGAEGRGWSPGLGWGVGPGDRSCRQPRAAAQAFVRLIQDSGTAISMDV